MATKEMQKEWALEWKRRRCQKSALKLIESCRGLIIQKTNQLSTSRVEKEDLISEAQTAILNAAENYNSEKGDFFPCAMIYVRAALIEFANQNRTQLSHKNSHVERRVQREIVRAMGEAEDDGLDMEQAIQRVATRLKTSPKHIAEALNARMGAVALDGDGWEQLAANDEGPEEHLTRTRRAEVLDQVMNRAGLDELDRQIIASRFAGRDDKLNAFETVAAELGLTRERARQRTNDALERMRGVMAKMGVDAAVV
ncbi:MAG: sigma-70 family RNA polymerase sigma factor [Alkalilacustris sp.]